MTDKCPNCGAELIMFSLLSRIDDNSSGLKCGRECGYILTFGDLRRQLAQLRALLAATEFLDGVDLHLGLCFSCGNTRDDGHTDDCPVKAALAQQPEGEQHE